MDVLLIFLTVFVTLIASLCTALLAPLRQLRSRVDPSYFKRVKLPYPISYLFVGIGGKRSKTGDVSKYGVIIPMFVLHILGYLLTLFIWAIVPVCYQWGIDLDVLFVIPLAVAVFDVIVVVLTEVICVAYANKKQLEDSYEEEPVEEAPVAPIAPVKEEVVEEVEQPAEEDVVEEPVAEEQIAEEPAEPAVEEVAEVVEETTVEPQPVEAQVEDAPAEEVQEQPVETGSEETVEEPAEPQVEETAEEPVEDKKDEE